MKAARQTTLRTLAVMSGVGVHSGQTIDLTLRPSEANTGIVFIRTDQPDREIRATARGVAATEFATVLGDATGPAVSTIEHLMAALSGVGVDNAVIELNGPEVPIMDGSAAPFVAAIDEAGVVALPATRRFLKVLKPVGVVDGDSYGELRPHHGFRLEIDIDFANPLVGRQSLAMDVTAASFRRQLARARTFGFTEDVERLWQAGYAHGASLANTLVIGGGRLLNPDGLRFKDEHVRHKALDAIGDLALGGAPILGAYKSTRGGHRLNYAVLTALLKDASAWTYVDAPLPAPEPRERALPTRGRGEVGAFVQPAFGPEIS